MEVKEGRTERGKNEGTKKDGKAEKRRKRANETGKKDGKGGGIKEERGEEGKEKSGRKTD